MDRATALFLTVFAALAIGCPAAAIAYDKGQETKQMTACVQSGQKWVINDRTRQHECVR
jgi:hypothetical protein